MTLFASCSPIFAVKKLGKTLPFICLRMTHTRSRSLIEQPPRNRLKWHVESTAGIIPGDRGKVGGSWCPRPLSQPFRLRQACLTSSSTRCRDRWYTKSGAERPGAIRNRVRAESDRRGVSTRRLTQLPGGLRLLLRRPERNRGSRRGTPAQGRLPLEAGAQRNRGCGE